MSRDANHRDPHVTPDRRVRDLIDRMTLAEKAGQLVAVPLRALDGHWDEGLVAAPPGLVSVPHLAVDDVARRVRELQRRLRDETRLAIPALPIGSAELPGATRFPTHFALAAGWDPDLVGSVAAASAVEARAIGLRIMLGPGLTLAQPVGADVEHHLARCFGGSPLLAAELVAAFVRGAQGRSTVRIDDLRVGCAALQLGAAAEFLAGGDSHADERQVRSVLLPTAQAAVRAGVAMIVPSSAANGGVPTHADPWLLRDVLRGEWGYTGVVLAAEGAVSAMRDDHRVVATVDEALALVLESGVDTIAAESTGSGWEERLVTLVRTGRIPQWIVDDAVSAVLRLKLRLGLFEDPDPADAARPRVGGAGHRALADRAVADTVVLVSDPRGLLPLGDGHHVGVLPAGPDPTGEGPTTATALAAALYGAVPDVRVRSAGAGRPDDITVVVVTGAPGDAAPAVARLVGVGTRCVVLLCGTRLRGLADLLGTTATVLLCWQAGRANARVYADVLTGAAEPGGRLPAAVGLDDARSGAGGLPIGHGGGYTAFEYSHLRLAPRAPLAGEPVTVECRVRNSGDREGKEVVQVYLHDRVGSVLPQAGDLAGFAAVRLEPGQIRRVRIQLPAERFALWDRAMRHVVEPGTFDVLVGRSARDIRLTATVTIDHPPDAGVPSSP